MIVLECFNKKRLSHYTYINLRKKCAFVPVKFTGYNEGMFEKENLKIFPNVHFICFSTTGLGLG